MKNSQTTSQYGFSNYSGFQAAAQAMLKTPTDDPSGTKAVMRTVGKVSWVEDAHLSKLETNLGDQNKPSSANAINRISQEGRRAFDQFRKRVFVRRMLPSMATSLVSIVAAVVSPPGWVALGLIGIAAAGAVGVVAAANAVRNYGMRD